MVSSRFIPSCHSCRHSVRKLVTSVPYPAAFSFVSKWSHAVSWVPPNAIYLRSNIRGITQDEITRVLLRVNVRLNFYFAIFQPAAISPRCSKAENRRYSNPPKYSCFKVSRGKLTEWENCFVRTENVNTKPRITFERFHCVILISEASLTCHRIGNISAFRLRNSKGKTRAKTKARACMHER